MLETGVPLYQGIVFSKKSAIQTNVFSLMVGLLGFASQKVQRHTFCYTHYHNCVHFKWFSTSTSCGLLCK